MDLGEREPTEIESRIELERSRLPAERVVESMRVVVRPADFLHDVGRQRIVFERSRDLRNRFIRSTACIEEMRVIVAAAGEVRTQLDCAREFALGTRPIVVVPHRVHAQRRMRFAQHRVESQRAFGVLLALRKRRRRRQEVDAQLHLRVGEAGVRERVGGIADDRLLEVGNRRLESVFAVAIPEVAALQIEPVRFRVCRRPS